MESLNDSAAPHRNFQVLKTRLFVFWTGCIALFVLLVCTNPFSGKHHPPSIISHAVTQVHVQDTIFPRKIWQTLDTPAQGLEDELRRFSSSWVNLNRDYRYELLTNDAAVSYVRERFDHRPDIVDIFHHDHDKALRAYLLRYLTLIAEGGVYAQSDAHCSKSIDSWVPDEYAGSTSLVVGVEHDPQPDGQSSGSTFPVVLCNWALMAKPSSRALQSVVDYMVAAHKMKDGPVMNSAGSDITSAEIFTAAILAYLDAETGRTVPYAEISNLKEPKLIGDVLVLPINAFGSGRHPSDSQEWDEQGQLTSQPSHRLGFRGLLAAYE